MSITDFLKITDPSLSTITPEVNIPMQSFVIVPHVSHLATDGTVDRGYHEEESWPFRHGLPLKAYSPISFCQTTAISTTFGFSDEAAQNEGRGDGFPHGTWS